MTFKGTAKRIDSIAEKKKIQTATSGKDLQYISTRAPVDLIHKVKVYCVTHEMKIQDFFTEALQDRLKKDD